MMRMRKYFVTGIAAMGVLLFGLNYGCDPIETEEIVRITTNNPSNITKNTCTFAGLIVEMGESGVENHGFVYSEGPNPTIESSVISLGMTKLDGQFSFKVSALQAGTSYFYRAFAQNGDKIYYGDDKSFVTLGLSFPSVSTNSVTNIQSSAFKAIGTINEIGDLPIVHHGFCLPVNPDPTNDDIHIDYGAAEATGRFEGVISDLSPGTDYYVRAYIETAFQVYYGNLLSLSTIEETQVSDADENVYSVINIGAQTWMLENLRVTRFADGTGIRFAMENSQWVLEGSYAYCWFLNSESGNKDIYGALYNWSIVNSEKDLCPSGWHIPDDADWSVLIEFLGGAEQAGGKLKEEGTAHWVSPNTGATNESGFTALPGSYRTATGEFFSVEARTVGAWWSAGDGGAGSYPSVKLYANDAKLHTEDSDAGSGYSVRCIKD
jgi:uncharacterized protein (TIGR02145 family)